MRTSKSFLKNTRGQSELAILLVGMSIILGFAAYMPKLFETTNKRLDYRHVSQVFRMISENIQSQVMNSTTWTITESMDINTSEGVIKNLKGLTCLTDGKGCANQAFQTGGYIVLYNLSENPYVNPFWDSASDPIGFASQMTDPFSKVGFKQGFTFQGEICYKWNPDPDIGNDDCPIRAITTWTPVCPTAVCLEPSIRVAVQFIFHPSLKYKDINVNSEKHNFFIDRKLAVEKVIGSNCDNIFDLSGGVFRIFIVPKGISSILVKAWGAGGAGAGGLPLQDSNNGFNYGDLGVDKLGSVNPDTSYIFPSGGGGGGGGFSTGLISVNPGEVVGIQIGVGGKSLNSIPLINIIAGRGGSSRVASPSSVIIAPGGEGGKRCYYDVSKGLCSSIYGDGLGGAGGWKSSSDYVVVPGRDGDTYNSVFNFHMDLEKSPIKDRYRNDYFYVTRGGAGGDAAYGGGTGGFVNHQNNSEQPRAPGGGGAGRQDLTGQDGAAGRVILCM